MKYWLRRNDSLLDWIVWQVMRYAIQRRARRARRRLAALAVVALVLAAGIALARRGDEAPPG